MCKKEKNVLMAGVVIVCILSLVFIIRRNRTPNPAEGGYEMLGRCHF